MFIEYIKINILIDLKSLICFFINLFLFIIFFNKIFNNYLLFVLILINKSIIDNFNFLFALKDKDKEKDKIIKSKNKEKNDFINIITFIIIIFHIIIISFNYFSIFHFFIIFNIHKV